MINRTVKWKYFLILLLAIEVQAETGSSVSTREIPQAASSQTTTERVSQPDNTSAVAVPRFPIPPQPGLETVSEEFPSREPDNVSPYSVEKRTRETPVSTDPLPIRPTRGGEIVSEPIPAMPGQRQSQFVMQPPDNRIPGEILVNSASLKEAEAQRLQLFDLGLTIKQRKVLGGLGQVLTVYRVPPQKDPVAFLDQVKSRLPEATLEYNRLFYLQGSDGGYGKEYAKDLVGLGAREYLGRNLTIAMLDAAVDVNHPALSGAHLSVSDVTGRINKPSKHGTAVASLLVGRNFVDGALPAAQLLAVNIFSKSESGQQQTRTDWWLYGLNELALAEPKPAVINMSFGGEYSALLAQALKILADMDVTLVAAVGNDGPESQMLFPASHEQVVGVTAIDARLRLFKGAPLSLTGPALAAPGVDVWAADLGLGGFYASGSSFASPWVTAIIAMAKQSGFSPAEVLKAARDLGPPGYDPQFGAGLINKL